MIMIYLFFSIIKVNLREICFVMFYCTPLNGLKAFRLHFHSSDVHAGVGDVGQGFACSLAKTQDQAMAHIHVGAVMRQRGGG